MKDYDWVPHFTVEDLEDTSPEELRETFGFVPTEGDIGNLFSYSKIKKAVVNFTTALLIIQEKYKVII